MGPRRTTLTYSSEDIGGLAGDKPLYVYYCRHSGKHALTTDCNLASVPRRGTDHALVLDTQEHLVKLYTSDGGAKLLRRKSGAVERQLRYNVGQLPVAYRTEPEGRYLYVLDGALTTYTADEGGLDGGRAPVPPCIVAIAPGKTQVGLEIEDRSKTRVVLRVTADFVRLAIKSPVSSQHFQEEVLELIRGVMGVRLGQLSLGRGESQRHKLLVVDGLDPQQVFQKLQAAVSKNPRRLGRSSKHVINQLPPELHEAEPPLAPKAAAAAPQPQQPAPAAAQ